MIGIWVGRVTAPSSSRLLDVESPGLPTTASLSSTQEALSTPSVATNKRAAGEGWVEPVQEEYQAWDDIRKQLVRKLSEWRGDPTEVVGVAIDAMSDRELRSALTSLTNLTEDNLDEVRDLRGFAQRLAAVAMNGVVSRETPEAPNRLADVQFSRSVDVDNAAELPQEYFAGDERIYAVFPMEEYREDEVFVKWYRSDDPEILLFDRYQIQQESGKNYVWLENENGWPEGEYTVEFYSSDETMEKVAAGRYFVVDQRGPSLENYELWSGDPDDTRAIVEE